MRRTLVIVPAAFLLVLGGLFGCGGEAHTGGPDTCLSEAYGSGNCAMIEVCCTAIKSACYLLANTQRLPCPGKNCVDAGVLSQLATVCDVAPDGDGGVDGDNELSAPASHTDLQSGVGHKPGKDDPLQNCAPCHGPLLTGGSGPTCYLCHGNAGHSSSREGVKHKSGGSTDCQTCHGPANGGGLGPACRICHGG